MAEILTVGGLVITVLLAYLRLQKQEQSNLRLQERHLKNQLHLEVYDKVADVLDDAAQAMARSGSLVRSIMMSGMSFSLGKQGCPLEIPIRNLRTVPHVREDVYWV